MKKKHTDPPQGIVIIQADGDGLDVKISQNMNYEDAKHLLIEAMHVVVAYEENSCIPDNMMLQ